MSALAPVMEAYFSQRLAARRASPRTVDSYRSTFCLLLGFAQRRTGKAPSALDLGELDASLIGAFLEHLQLERGNSPATCNLRLAAIHSLYSYAALRCPEHAGVIQAVLAIPRKRTDMRIVSFLTRGEVEALVSCTDRSTWMGRRDYLLMVVGVQTGLRVSELTGLTWADVELAAGANLYCHGKGRKERRTPLTAPVVRGLRDWMAECGPSLVDPVFPTRKGTRLSTDAVADLLAKYAKAAARLCPTLETKRVSPHVLRHTAAMNLLQADVDTSTIALWLGHAGIRSTQVYLHADLEMKEKALARTAPVAVGRSRYRPGDPLLAFLKAL